MRAGLLDEVIKVLRPEITTNDFGETEETYNEVCTEKARLVHDRGSRDIENGEIVHNYQKTLEVWKYVDVRDTDWIEWNGKQYRILDIEPDKVQQKQVITIELIND